MYHELTLVLLGEGHKEEENTAKQRDPGVPALVILPPDLSRDGPEVVQVEVAASGTVYLRLHV